VTAIADTPPGQQDEDVTYCATHPTVETELRCSRCEKPICPRCLVQTPVGARCRECGTSKKSPIYTLTPMLYARMAALAIIGGGLVGLAWALVAPGAFFIGFFSLIVAGAVGWIMAKGIERAANYKRGRPVQLFAVGGILIAYAVRSAFVYDGLMLDIYGLIGLAVACYVAISNLR
jgi:hypothetical protein